MVIKSNKLAICLTWLNRRINRLSRLGLSPFLALLSVLSVITVTVGLLILALLQVSEKQQTTSPHGCRMNAPWTGTQNKDLPTIYAITPTYARHVQKAELTRLSHTFLLVPKIHWILVEDSNQSTSLVSKFVQRLDHDFGFNSVTHLQASTPEQYKLKPGQASWKFPKGIWQRNKALDWILDANNRPDPTGIVYFADDDNTYDLELFEEMRSTRFVSVWPVALAGGMLVERPLIREGKVVAFNSMWQSKRPFPIDMAGFAVSLRALTLNQNVRFSSRNKIGYVESHFLSQLINSWDQLEPKAANCTKVLVWHTRSQPPVLHEERKLSKPSSEGIDI